MDFSSLKDATGLISKLPSLLEKLLPILEHWEQSNNLAPGELISYNLVRAKTRTIFIYVWVIGEVETKEGEKLPAVKRQITKFDVMEIAKLSPEELLMKFANL
jgi:hypothetical protein